MALNQKTLQLKPIGAVQTDVTVMPRHWTQSQVEGVLEIDPQYEAGLANIEAGQRIVVLFHFDRSPPFSASLLKQPPRGKDELKGVFSICSPRRPNPIGLSVLDVIERKGCRIRVKGLDMHNGTPILDIKPHVEHSG